MASVLKPAVPLKGILRAPSTVLFLCDMQEKFRNNICFFPEILEASKRLVKTFCWFFCLSTRSMQRIFSTCPSSLQSRYRKSPFFLLYTFTHSLKYTQQIGRFLILFFPESQRYPLHTISIIKIEALGSTVSEYSLGTKKNVSVFAKTQFSMITDDVLATLAKYPTRQSILLCGIEVS